MGTIAARDCLRVLELTEQVAAAHADRGAPGRRAAPPRWRRSAKLAASAGGVARRRSRAHRAGRGGPRARPRAAARCWRRSARGRWSAVCGSEPSADPEIEHVAGPFHDLDPMEVVWHGHYVKYLELARCALLTAFDYDYPQMRESGYAGRWSTCALKYVRPPRFGQPLRVRAEIVEWENRLRIEYLITRRRQRRAPDRAPHHPGGGGRGDAAKCCFVCPPVLWERLGVRAMTVRPPAFARRAGGAAAARRAAAQARAGDAWVARAAAPGARRRSLRGEFEQEKRIGASSNPLALAGRLPAGARQGVVWTHAEAVRVDAWSC